MTVQGDVAAVLQANVALMAILTGGIYEQDEVGEISRQDTPSAFDNNKELKPCVLIAEGTELRRGGIDDDDSGTSVQTPISIFFYERSGYSTIAAAMEASFALLNGKKIGSATWRVEYENSIKNQKDTALNASLGVQRFMVVRLR